MLFNKLTVSYNGNPTILEYDPFILITNLSANPWIAYDPALSTHWLVLMYWSISLLWSFLNLILVSIILIFFLSLNKKHIPVITLWFLPDKYFKVFFASFSSFGFKKIFCLVLTMVSAAKMISFSYLFCVFVLRILIIFYIYFWVRSNTQKTCRG